MPKSSISSRSSASKALTIETDGATSTRTSRTSPTSPKRGATFNVEEGEEDEEPLSPLSPTAIARSVRRLSSRVLGMSDTKGLSRSLSMNRSSLKSGGSVLERALSDFGMTERSMAASALSERALQSVEVQKQTVLQRRGEQKRHSTLYQAVDNGAEHYFSHSLEQPWCLNSCMKNPECQRLCDPAEFATRHRHELEGTGDGGAAGRGGGAGDGEKMFGLPEWEKTGYVLCTPEETSWVDDRMQKKLGLQMAVHRKTSVERLCLQRHKADLPVGVNKEQLATLARNLKRCDHVNVLRCYEMCEDETNIYLLYENFPCITLVAFLGILEEERSWTWTQEQLVNLVREVCAAVAFATSIGLTHLGWTLCHVLMPVSSLSGDPMVAKIFGFGHMGNIHVDSTDRMCWAPEALESWLRGAQGFLNKMETNVKMACDCWSLGVIIYSLVARRPPFLGKPEAMTDMIVQRKWTFALAFDEVDREAKSLVEGLLEANHEKRFKADTTLRNEWIRRRWRPPSNGHKTFLHLEEFCTAPLPKRLFGRFLMKFLNAEHLRHIAQSFYALDSLGNGVIMKKDLLIAAKFSERPESAARSIHEWMCADGTTISLARFAESMAEDVIDGRALRHAFESLDDDGSEQISPEELFAELRAMDDNLTFEQIVEHVQEADQHARKTMRRLSSVANGGVYEDVEMPPVVEGKDITIDFEEFVRLFPVRVQRLQLLQDRVDRSQIDAHHTLNLFTSVEPEATKWFQHLTDVKHSIEKLQVVLGDRENKEAGDQAVKDLKRYVHRVAEYVRNPPGPHDMKTRMQAMQMTSRKKKKSTGPGENDTYGFDTFLQDQAMKEFWGSCVNEEIKSLKHAQTRDAKTGVESTDQYKAHDASDTVIVKINEILAWAGGQMEEYKAFVEVLAEPECALPTMMLSSRGLQHHGDEADDEGDGEEGDGVVDEQSGNVCVRMVVQCRTGSCRTLS